MAMMFPAIFMFFIFALIEAGPKKDRYVMRENSPVEMDCNGELENATRVRWEYISTYDIGNGNEIIYDSQSDKEFKNGFEVSCQPHQTFISKCTLTLLQAKYKNSGKYLCCAGDASENKFDSNLEPIVEIELVIRGPIYRTIVANQGKSVILPCEHNIKNITRTRWSHVSLQGAMTYNLFYLNGKATSHHNFQGLCGRYQPSCNLKIIQANKESAGRYICMVGESLEFEEKYGMFQMTYFIEIDLVVGELSCNENMNKDLTLIGENDCHGIEADVLNLKCSFNYFGNINYNLLHLRWIQKYKFNSLEKKLNSSLIKHEVKDETNKISIQTNLSVAYEMQNSIFQCVLNDTLVKPCQLNEFRIQYIKNTTSRYPPMYSTDLHNIKCSANKSANVQCSYYWVHEIAGAMVENPYAILPVENMNSPGAYTCIGKCYVGEHKACIINAMEFEVVQRLKGHGPYLSHLNIGLLSGLIIMAFANITWVIIFMLRKKRCFTRTKNSIGNFGIEENEKNPLIDQNQPKRKMSSITELEVPKCSPDLMESSRADQTKLASGSAMGPNTSNIDLHGDSEKKIQEKNSNLELVPASTQLSVRNSEHSCDRDKIIGCSSNQLSNVEENLHEEGSKHHNMIHKSPNMKFDEAIQKTEFDELEKLSILSVHCHPYPRNVLVVGRGMGSIAKRFSKIPEAEYITVFDNVKRFNDCYCDYFPSFSRCMVDPKVKLIVGDVIMFLMSQKQMFDAIISYSSSLCKSPGDCLFSEKYYENVKLALREGGFTSLIVTSGKDMAGFNIIESNLINYLGELFPVVRYFQKLAFIHPGDLTPHEKQDVLYINSFVCSLDQGAEFEGFYEKWSR